MSDYSEIQKKIVSVVEAYKQFYPDEYVAVCKQVKDRQAHLPNKFGDFTKTNKTDVLERSLNEFPETLFFLFQKTLSESEQKYFNSIKGQHWFGKHFSEFRVTKTI
jgi:hypothetical protein